MKVKIKSSAQLIEALKNQRKKKKITQKELLGFADLSKAGIIKIENLQSDPKVSTILKLAKLLNVNLYYEIDEDEE
jgi:transcriptional regulator with XRE-family HTH domain